MALSKLIKSLFVSPAKPTLRRKNSQLQRVFEELESRLVPANANWTGGAGDAQWATTGNWNATPVPATGNTATFNAAAGAGGAVIGLGAGVTVGTVLFDTANAVGYTIGSGGVGGQTLTFDNTGAATVNATVVNNQLFNANVVLGTTGAAGTTTLTNNSPTATLTLAGAIQGGTGSAGAKTLTVTGAGNTFLNGAISNGGASSIALNKTGTGTLTLGSANSNTGSTSISGLGTLRTNASNAIPNGALSVAAGATLDLNGNNATVTSIFWGASGGAFGLVNTIATGAGTLNLNGNITYDSDSRSGANIISGNLNLGAATRTFQITGTDLPSTGTRQATGLTISANISGDTGTGITVTSTGNYANALNLSGNNTYPGTTNFQGYIKADSSTALGSGGSITFNNASSILLYTANSAGTDWATRFKSSSQAVRLDTGGQNVALAGIIDNTNTGGLTKLGAGTLTLSASNTYTGTTTVNAGTLLLDKSSTGAIVSTSALTLGGGTFRLKAATSGSTTQTLGNVTVNSGNGGIVLDPNGGSGVNLTVGNTWSRSAGGTLGIDLSAGTSTITSTGGLAAGTQTPTQAVLGYAIVTDASGAGFATNVGGSIVRYTGASTLASNSTGATTNFATAPMGTSTASSPYLTLGLNVAPSYNTLNIDTSSATGGNVFDLNFNTVTLTQSGLLMTGANNFAIQGGQLGAANAELIVHQTGTGSLTLASQISSGSGSLTKDGAGLLILPGTNVFTGGTTINEGVIKIQHGDALGTSGNITVNNGAALQLEGGLIVNSSKTLNLAGGGVNGDGALRSISGVNVYNGNIIPGLASAASLPARISADSGTLILPNTIGSTSVVNAGNLVFSGAGDVVVSGAIHTLTGSVTKEGSGKLILQGGNAFTGGVNINNGTVTLMVAQTLSGVVSLGNVGPFGRSGVVSFGGGTLQFSALNQFDYSSRFSTDANQAIKIDTNGQNVTFATNLTSSGGSLSKSGIGTLTISGTGNTYTGGTTIDGGTLLLSGTGNMPATGAVTVSAGGTFSLADGTARTTTTAASLNLTDGATLAFDWSAGTQDRLTSTAAVTASGRIGIVINNLSPTGSGGVLLSSPLGGLLGATYYLVNNTGYTATLSVTDTEITISAQTAGTPLVDNAFWYGNTVAASNTLGLDNAMAVSTGTLSNWSTSGGSYTATGLVPGATANVVFSATGATQQSNIVLGANMTLNRLTFNDAAAVTINGSNALTLMSGGNAANSAISTNQDATINSGLALGANQTWTTAATKTLTIGGTVVGNFGLSIAGAGTTSLTGTGAYSGSTTVNNGSTLNVASGSNKSYQGTSSTLVVTGVANIAGNVDVETLGASGLNGVMNLTSGGVLTVRNASVSQDQNAGIGNGGYGMLNIAGGTVNVLGGSGGGPGSINLANGGNQSLLRVTNGTLNVGQIIMFRNGAGSAELTITGGTINKSGSEFVLGDRGTMNSVVNIAGGFIDNTNQNIRLNRSTAATAGSALQVVNFNAGTILTKEFTGTQAGYQSIINYNGGTIRASAGISTTAFTPTPAATSSISSYVNGPFGTFNGGVVFDTNGNSVGLNSNLLAPTGNGVTSLALSTGGSGYTGAPIVTISDSGISQSGTVTLSNTITMADTTGVFVGQSITGTGIPAGSIVTGVTANTSITISQVATVAGTPTLTFKGQGATAYANILNGAVTEFVVTNPGVGYVGTVTAAVGGGFGTGGSGTAATFGTITLAANTSGGLTKNGAGTLTLTGVNTYTGANVVNAGILAFGQSGILTATAISGLGAVSQTGTGVTILGSTSNTYSGQTLVSVGALQIAGPSNLSPNSNLNLNGGVLQLSGGQTFTATLGTAATEIQLNNNGGFSAIGGNSTVSLNGGADLTWGVTPSLPNGIALLMSSATADSTIELLNNLNLNGSNRTISVTKGTGTDLAKFSGVISNSSGTAGITKQGTGSLELSNDNTYNGPTAVSAGTLVLSGSNLTATGDISVASTGAVRFDTTNSINGGAHNVLNRDVTVSLGGTAYFGPAFGAGNIQTALNNRILASSAGAIGVDNYAAANFDFSAATGANFTAASLGSVGNVTYTGTYTPNLTGGYRLGGAGGTITMAGANALTGALPIDIKGNVVIANTNNATGTTTVNSGATLTFGTGLTGENGSFASTSYVNSGTIVFNNFEDIIFTGVISGTGTIIKNGPGKVTFTAPQTFSGIATINAGSLAFVGGTNNLPVNKSVTMTGGTLDLGGSSQYVGVLTVTSGSITADGGTLTIRPTGATTFPGTFDGSVDIVKIINQTLTLTGNSTTTGSVSVLGGDTPGGNGPTFTGLTLTDNGRLAGVLALNLSNGTLTLTNTGSVGNNDRVNDAASVSLSGGRIVFTGRDSTASTETLGAVNIASGLATLNATRTGTGSAVLTLTNLTRNVGSVLRVDGTNLGQTGSNGRIIVNGGLAGNLVPVNNVVPGVVIGGALVGYVSGQGFGAFGTTGFPAYTTGTLAAAAVTANFQGGGAVPSGGKTVNALQLTGALTFSSDSDVLNLTSGMIVIGSEQGPTFGNDAGVRGKITSGLSSGELFLYKINGGSGGTDGAFKINSVFADNGATPVKLIIASDGRQDLTNQRPNLTANNLHTGGTTISGGSEVYLTSTTAGATPIPAASDPTQGLIINNSTVTMRTNAQQIAPSNIVTLNGGSLLTLTGANNTLAGLVFNSNGGRNLTPTVTGGTKMTITGNISSTPSDLSVTPLISTVLDFNNTSTHDITVDSLYAVPSTIGLSITSVIQNGGFTKKGTGVLSLGAANTYTLGTTVSAGTLLLNGAFNMPATGALTVQAGGSFSLADGVRRATSAASLNLQNGANLTVDWAAGAIDTLTSTGAATTTGNVGITVNPAAPTGSGLSIITSSAGGLQTANATKYFLANNTNFTATLSQTDTAVTIGSYAAAPTLGNAYWLGGQVTNAVNAMAFSSGTTSNWAAAAGDTTPTAAGVVPGSSANVFFSTTTGATQQSNIVLGNSMTVNSLTFNDTTPVTIGADGNYLTLNSGASGSASAINVNQDATINAKLVLATDQTWTTATGKTLTIGGEILGPSSLTAAGAGTITISAAASYTGNTIASSGKLTIAPTGSINSTATVSIAGGHFNYNSSTSLSKPITFSGSGGILSGEGTIGTAVTVAAGNTLAPGNAIGVLTFTNTLALQGSAAFVLSGNAIDGTYDKVSLTTAAPNYGGTLDVSFAVAPTTAGTYTLFNFTGTPTGGFSAVNLPATPSGFAWFDYDAGAGVDYFNDATGQIQLVATIDAPTIASITPVIGPTTGGTLLAINGSNFISISSVVLDGNSLSFSVTGTTLINVTTPAHAAGSVDIVVTNPAGSVSLAGGNDFTYAKPAISSIEVNGGPSVVLGGSSWSLAGQNSVVKQILVTFNQAVSLATDAFAITPVPVSINPGPGVVYVNGGALPSTADVTASIAATLSPSSYLITFSGPGTHGGNVINSGVYDLTTIASKVSANGETMASDQANTFFAMFGNIQANNLYAGSTFTTPIPPGYASGDGLTNAFVDPGSLFQFSDAFGSNAATPVGPPAYNIIFDSNLDGFIDPGDLFAFSDSFGIDWDF